MQLYAQTFFATPGQPLIPPPGSAFTNINLVTTERQQPKILPLEDLRHYLRAARTVRPKLVKDLAAICRTREERITPADHFLLTVEPDSRFRLERLRMLEQDIMDKEIKSLMDKYVPEEPLIEVESTETHIRTANFNIPAPGFLIFANPLPPVVNVMTLTQHTLQLLETSERVLNVVWPKQSQGHTFVIPTESNIIPPADNEICIPIYYTKVRERDLVDFNEPMVKMVVLVVPPWAFAEGDLYDLLNIRQFPTFKTNDDGTNPTLTRTEKLLAQIYDCCTAKNCPFFAVTTLANWIFGAFSVASGWSQVLCSPNISYADFQPSLLEWVTFWGASSLKVPEAFCPTQYPSSEAPELGSDSNLQVPVGNERLSDKEWLEKYLDPPQEPAYTHFTYEVSDNVWVTHIL